MENRRQELMKSPFINKRIDALTSSQMLAVSIFRSFQEILQTALRTGLVHSLSARQFESNDGILTSEN
jgi:hypothetical protein